MRGHVAFQGGLLRQKFTYVAAVAAWRCPAGTASVAWTRDGKTGGGAALQVSVPALLMVTHCAAAQEEPPTGGRMAAWRQTGHSTPERDFE